MTVPATAAPLATVALIAHGIIERKVRFGALDSSDFNHHTIPGSNGITYVQRTMRTACEEAWALVKEAENTRPY